MQDLNSASVQTLSIAQTLLNAKAGANQLTPAFIAEQIELARELVNNTSEGAVDVDAILDELIRRYSVLVGTDAALSDRTDHESWLNAGRKRDWRYWDRYREMLERSMSTRAVEAIDASTDRIIGLLEDPLRQGRWDRRGLVVGHVQSGKTASYTGLICKAADAGYKIIIVLAGLHNNLRAQTQIRLEEGFLGYSTEANPSANGAKQPIGVGTGGRDMDIAPNCATTRADSGDFTTAFAHRLTVKPESRPWLFVVKKNKMVLERLLDWIRDRASDHTDDNGHPIVTHLPLLLIDDEADHASVDTGEQLMDSEGRPDEEHEPKAINSNIRKILNSFARSAYVGYTATPFANIFIHRNNETAEEGPDLFPRSFIINLSAPSNYVGPARVFGLKAHEGRSGLPLVRTISDHVTDDGKSGWMPPKHRKDHVPLFYGLDRLPASLEEAVRSFVLACAAREVRGQARRPSTMLVHVTRFTQVQGEVQRQVDEYVSSLRRRIVRRIDDREVMNELQKLWERDFQPTSADIAPKLTASEEVPPRIEWQQILEHIPDVLSDMEVRTVNGTAKDALDYQEDRPSGLRVIAVGGDKLARGLTLEGLCTSYFVRTTKMYDTLMQMGRWFGYRPGYIDLCRLYTTAELVEWFGHITDASEELREEFDAMAASGATPRDYGMRVQSHPVLLVTSPLKMRSARNLQLSFSGELLETVSMHVDRDILDRNLKTTQQLLSACGTPSEINPVRSRNGSQQRWDGYLWRDISPNHVINFFEHFVTHPEARKVNSTLLKDFVGDMTEAGELTSWTVALLGGGTGGSFTFECGLRMENMIRRSADSAIRDRYSIGRLLSPRDEAIDLDETAWDAALKRTRLISSKDPGRTSNGAPPKVPDAPNGPAIRHVRGKGSEDPYVPPSPQRGLLLIYPLDPQQSGCDALVNRVEPVMAFGVSFPASDSGVKVEYAVDHLKWAVEYGAAD